MASVVATVVALTVAATPVATATTTAAASDREISFVVDGTTTFGTLHVPAHRAGATLAAALLIPGSGATDRDGNVPPTVTPATLRLIADLLGTDGIMTYRFDKYATGKTGFGRIGDPSRLDMPAYTRQAVAAYATLRAQPETNTHRMLIVGHSEGGLQALLVARAVRPAPAGLALLAPQDLRILDIIAFQVDDQLDTLASAGTISAADAAATKAGVARVIAEFRASKPLDTSGMLPAVATFFATGIFGPDDRRFVRSDDAIYPPDIAQDVRPGTRVLFTCGTADVQVPCWTAGPELAVLARRHVTGPGLRVLPGLDHFLHPAGTPINDQILDPVAQRALLDFVRPFAMGCGTGSSPSAFRSATTPRQQC
jgi:pimeloyl-ACP methyl ester carboxylesterase